jgi:hypothetical protein
MNRRGFIKVLGLTGATSVLIPWKPLVAEEMLDGVHVSHQQPLTLDPAFKQHERARRAVDWEKAEAVMNKLRETLAPHVSFVDWERYAAIRGWALVATRWYVTPDGTRREIGVQTVLTQRDLATMPDSVFEKIPESASQTILDALARKEREDKLTWNAASLVGWA